MRDLQTNLVLGPADDLVAGAAEEKERLGCSESNILDMLRVGDSQDSGHDSPHRLEKSRKGLSKYYVNQFGDILDQ